MKKDYSLTILTVNFHTFDFISLIAYSIQQLNHYPTQLLIADNSNSEIEFNQLEGLVATYPNISIYKLNQSLKGSEAHGNALNFLIKKINTPYFVILDADASFLIKDWDKILIERLNNQVKLIGTQSFTDKKPKDFPLIQAILLETATFKNLNINFLPKDIVQGLDTGWELREKYLAAGYQAEVINYQSTKIYKKGPFCQLLCGEYYLEGLTSIVASHFERGSNLGSYKYIKHSSLIHRILYRLPIIGKYLVQKRGLSEKERWINICKQLINAQ